jgi:hypothetical protein
MPSDAIAFSTSARQSQAKSRRWGGGERGDKGAEGKINY